MNFKCKLNLILQSVLFKVLESHESVLFILKWPFILLILDYLQEQFLSNILLRF